MTSLTGFNWRPQAARSDTPLADPKAIAQTCAENQWSEEQLNDPDWFTPHIGQLHDPKEMHGMPQAVERLKFALDNNQRIRIITDYDVDGTTSSLILQATLRILHPTVALDYHIPGRFDEGYGFSTIAAQRAADDNIELIITADIGIRDQAAVSLATTHNVDVLICDHHLPPGSDVPQGAVVLCPPQKDCDYPNPHLAACGVSLKLAQAMLCEHPRFEQIFNSMLKLAAIGTVADMVPLTTAENRAIVTLGLRELNEARHGAGLDALLQAANAKRGQIDEGTIGYQIGPRINAAGRMADAKIVVQMLNCRQPQQARELAKRVDTMNRERKAVQEKLSKQALEQISEPAPPFILVAGKESDGWHRGVVGIVASRIMRSTHRPTAVISIQPEQAVGSMRSIDGVHCVQLLDSVADLLLKYGGHPKAAGFSLLEEHLEAFETRLIQAVENTAKAEDLVPVHTYSVHIHAEALTLALLAELKRLGPFGIGNPKPVFLLKNIPAKNLRTLSEGKHLKFQIRAGSGTVDVLWWNQGDRLDAIANHNVDLLGTLSVNIWNGRQTVQFIVQDARLTPQ